MNKRMQARLKKLQAPATDLPLVCFVDGPIDMSMETAVAMLKIKCDPNVPLFYCGILEPGARPTAIGYPEISDARWKKLKNYPRDSDWCEEAERIKKAEDEAKAKAELAAAPTPATKAEREAERAHALQLALDQEHRDNALKAMWDRVNSFSGRGVV